MHLLLHQAIEANRWICKAEALGIIGRRYRGISIRIVLAARRGRGCLIHLALLLLLQLLHWLLLDGIGAICRSRLLQLALGNIIDWFQGHLAGLLVQTHALDSTTQASICWCTLLHCLHGIPLAGSLAIVVVGNGGS